MIIKIEEIIKGRKTYPNWTTNSEYALHCKKAENKKVKVYYTIEKGIKRTIEREFPAVIDCDPAFCWALGFLKGEGSNSLGKSNYRRFTITNKEPGLIIRVLKKLEEKHLFNKLQIIKKSCHLIHFTEKESKVISYWSEELKLPKDRFKCFSSERNTSSYGVCHIYVSDVLLRRVIDLISEKIAE